MELAEALKAGLGSLGEKPAENAATDEELLYAEFKDAKDSESGIRALRQLVKLLK